MLMLGSLIPYSQTSSTDSSKCFTIEQAKLLLSYAEKGYICDSLISTYDKAIQDFENILIEKQEQLQISEMYINSLTNEIDKHRRRNKLLISVCGGLGIACVILTIHN